MRIAVKKGDGCNTYNDEDDDADDDKGQTRL
jgi:hypothetical protein